MSGPLWLCIAPQRLPLDALGLEDADNIIVTTTHGARRWVVASRAPVFPGADAREVLAARPELQLRDARPEAERATLETLAAIGHTLGAPVHCAHVAASPERPAGHAAVWVEIGRSLRLFGGIDDVLGRARELLAEQPVACNLAVAPTPEGAALAARLRDGHVLPDTAALRDWLRDVPLPAAHLPADVRDNLAASGIRRLGQLLELPVDQLARRCGSDTVRWLDRLTGRAPDPRPRHRLPRRFTWHHRFDGAVQQVEALLFALRRAFGAQATYLRARDCGARSLTLTLAHEDTDDTTLPLRLAAPARDAGYWLLLARERLSRVTLPAPVTALHLHCDDFAPLDAPQLDLFDTAHAEEDAWRQTVERLIARLGDDAVWQLTTAADHRPERAWQRIPALQKPAPEDSTPLPERPLWLIDPPRPLPRPPRVHGTPERIEAGWWDGTDTARDYYTAHSNNGTRLWVFRDHADERWFLHGLWA